VFEEEIDGKDPTEEEIFEYAEYLGMELPEDEEFLYIAREAMKAPLPEEWKPCRRAKDGENGEVYYRNFQTNQVSTEHPCYGYYRNLFAKEKNKKQI